MSGVSPSFSFLSNELILRIIEYLAERGLSRALSSLALACRKLHHLVSPYLLAHFTLTDASLRELLAKAQMGTDKAAAKKKGSKAKRERGQWTLDDLKRCRFVTVEEIPRKVTVRRVVTLAEDMGVEVLMRGVHSLVFAPHEAEEKRIRHCQYHRLLKDGEKVMGLARLIRPHRICSTSGRRDWASAFFALFTATTHPGLLGVFHEPSDTLDSSPPWGFEPPPKEVTWKMQPITHVVDLYNPHPLQRVLRSIMADAGERLPGDWEWYLPTETMPEVLVGCLMIRQTLDSPEELLVEGDTISFGRNKILVGQSMRCEVCGK